MTKTEMRQQIRDHARSLARRDTMRGFCVEVLVYRDADHWREGMGQHDAMTDLIPLSEALRRSDLLQEGRVWDCYIYQTLSVRSGSRTLRDAAPVTIGHHDPQEAR